VPDHVAALPLLGIDLIPVVSPLHPLARLIRPVTFGDLAEHTQLFLTDPTAPDGPSYGIIGTRAWGFAELGQRLDFLLAGLGWCRMPDYLVSPHLADVRLVPLAIDSDPARASGPLMIYAACMQDRALGRAGSWLLERVSGTPLLTIDSK